MKPNLIEVYNLFCAVCVQFDPSLPLIHHTKNGSFAYADVDDGLLTKLYDLAFSHQGLYRKLIAADGQERQLLQLEVINLLWTKCKDYIL